MLLCYRIPLSGYDERTYKSRILKPLTSFGDRNQFEPESRLVVGFLCMVGMPMPQQFSILPERSSSKQERRKWYGDIEGAAVPHRVQSGPLVG